MSVSSGRDTPSAEAAAISAHHPVLSVNRRALVTGAGGMLGQDVVTALAASGWTVVPRAKAELDVTDPNALARAFRDARPDVVVNCAAFTKVDACETDPRAAAVNAEAVDLIAAECLERGTGLVHVSTDFVFDGRQRTPYREEDEPAPLSAYGRTKREGEEAALRAPHALVVRSSWLFGRGGWNFVEAILKQVESGQRELAVVADQTGRPTATPDLAEAIAALLQTRATGIYHFANRGEASWWDFARAILDLTGRADVTIRAIDSATLARPAERPAYSVLDTTKYEAKTGAAIRPWHEAVAEYLEARARPEA